MGKPLYSVKRAPVASLPVNLEDPIGNAVCQDLLHMANRMGERVSKRVAKVSAQLTGEKFSDSFQQLARSTGVPFNIYEASVRGKPEIKLSSMTGRNWRRLLYQIGPKIRASTNVLPEELKLKFALLFETLDSTLSFAGKCRKEDAAEVARRTNTWIKLYLELGFEIKPYDHVFHLHLPNSVELFGGQDRLSGELVEKKNDSLKKTHSRKTNRMNPQMTLRTQLRIEHHEQNQEMKAFEKNRKRKARTQDPSVTERIRERGKENRRQEDEERRKLTEQRRPYSDLSILDLRNLVQEKTGKRTLKRTREALIDMIWHAENGGQCQSSGIALIDIF